MTENLKKTLVVGGSWKPERFSNKAIRLLRDHNHPVVSIGLRDETVEDVQINKDRPAFDHVHTVTMYVGPARQPDLYGYLLGLKPERIIFNPGTENDEFLEMASSQGVEVVNHCTLIMLNEGLF